MTFAERIQELQIQAVGMNRSQRSLLAAKLKTDLMRLRPNIARRNGKLDSTKEAARLLDISIGMLSLGDQLLRYGTDELIRQVEAGELTVHKAVRQARVPHKPRLQELVRCWRQCSPAEQQQFIEDYTGNFSLEITSDRCC